MRIKSYFTDSVQEAIEHARIELGPEAMLMNSKKTEPELRALGAYEVVFGVASDVASASSTVLPKKTAVAPEMAVVEKRRPANGSGGISKGLAALLAATQPALDAPPEATANAPVTSPIASSPAAFTSLSFDAVAFDRGALNTPALSSPATSSPASNSAASSSAIFNPGDASHSAVAVLETSVKEPAQPSLLQNRLLQGSAPAPSGDLNQELADLREQIEAVKRSMQQPRDWAAHAKESFPEQAGVEALPCSPDLERGLSVTAWPLSAAREIEQQLTNGGFSGEFAAEIGESVGRVLSLERQEGTTAGTTAELREAALYAELSRRLRVAPGLWPADNEAAGVERAILFAGPAGSGKTTSLLKLALRHSLSGRIPLQILTLDTLRVGGWEQLAAYSRIAGLAFNVIHSPAGLGQALAEYRGKKLVLIDTPGLSPSEWRETPELAAWVVRELARDAAFEVQLVLSAATRPAIAQRALEQFRALRPGKLLLTHLDEVEAPGVALELAMRSELPLSYLTNGQQIPEDLEEAEQTRLLAPFAAASALSSQVAAAA